MSKTKKEDCRTVSIYDFKKWHRLNSFDSGTITWTTSPSGNKNSISYTIRIDDENHDSYLKLNYTITDQWTNEKHHIDQKYPIISLPCHYGGKRYFFKCSLFKNGIHCGRKVAKLYLGAGIKYFGCRHCYDLTYESRFNNFSYSMTDIDAYGETIKRWYYRDKPTKKHIIYLKKNASLERGFIRMTQKLTNLYGRI
ncbi:MAG: hypothetical protein EOM19_04620 [Candidatus Moranbacteria bacterium]|nr:hypothetical protein [Candidatus Moranbacteria bacterium]